MTDTDPRSAEAIRRWMQDHVAGLIGGPATAIDPAADFDSYGIDSVQAVDMVTALEVHLGLEEDGLPMELLFDADSLAEAAVRVAAHLQRAA